MLRLSPRDHVCPIESVSVESIIVVLVFLSTIIYEYDYDHIQSVEYLLVVLLHLIIAKLLFQSELGAMNDVATSEFAS